MPFQSTKTYGHEVGLSCAFRQWRAKSHCNKLHGYALSFSFVFEANELDERNWVVDFGGLKVLKAALQDTFDHKTAVATDDPLLAQFRQLHNLGAIDLVRFPAVGCEAFAELAYGMAVNTLNELGYGGRVRVVSCEVREHGANSAIYVGE